MANSLGKRLELLRMSKGITQVELGKKVGLSQRMISHYENQIKRVPASMLTKFAKALSVSIDQLLGTKNIETQMDSKHASLWRRLKKAQRLPKKDQKSLLQYLDLLLERRCP